MKNKKPSWLLKLFCSAICAVSCCVLFTYLVDLIERSSNIITLSNAENDKDLSETGQQEPLLPDEGNKGGAASIVPANNVPESTVEMSVHFIDVGQGDATLVINGDYAMLIDAGIDDYGTRLQLYLQKQGIEKLDYLILTHTDADHIGAADVIITKFPIDTVFMGDYPKNTVTYRDTLAAFNASGLSYMIPSAGSTYELGDAFFTFVNPGKEYDNSNDSSLCFFLQKGDNTFLFTGDAGMDVEEDILDAGWDLSADVYHVGHHGSRYSSCSTFLEAVSPTYAVISCGEDNEYGHPHAQTLNTLRKMGVKVFRTDEQGTIVATTSGVEIKWNCAPSETWKAGEITSR